jgi:urease accessory protein
LSHRVIWSLIQLPNQLPDSPIARLPDARTAEAIGRAARLELVFERRGERTILAHGYAEPPFRIGRTFDLGGAAYVILVTSGPGVFAGDTLHQSIHVGRGARVVLTSQSALQVHPGPSALSPCLPALIEQHYFVEDEGELHCHWDPVIPFAGARLEQRFDLRIAESSRLFWGDAVMAGRVQRGEAWRFLSLAHELRLRIGPALAYLERYTLSPDPSSAAAPRAGDRRLERPWICGGAPYLATALVRHEGAGPETADALHREMAELAGVRSAVDLLQPRLLLARFLAGNGAPFARARASYRTAVLRAIFGGAELAGRK